MNEIAFWTSLGTAVLVVVALAAALLFLRGARAAREPAAPAPPGGEATALVEAIGRAEEQRARLQSTLQQVDRERRWTQRAAVLGQTLSVEEAAGEALAAARELARADGAMIRVVRSGGEASTWAVGLSEDEQESLAAASGDPTPVRAVVASFLYGREATRARGVETSLAVALVGRSGDPLGNLYVFWRGEGPAEAERELEGLEDLAGRAGAAIENALRYEEARDLADRDSLTGLYNRRYFHDALEREVARSNRHERDLSLIVLDIDRFKEINERLGHLGGDRIIAAAGHWVATVARRTDLACRIGGDELAVILPESRREDAEHLYGRIQLAITAQPLDQTQRVEISGGIAQLVRGETATALFERADRALYRAKRAGRGRVVFDDDVIDI